MRYGVFFLACAGLCAQSLEISRSAARRGAPGSFLIALNAPSQKQPVALQWTVWIPEGVTIEKDGLVAGSAALSAEKALTCAAAKPKSGERAGFICIVAGGTKAIRDGPVAVVQYRVSAGAPVGPKTVTIEDAMGASAANRKIDIPKAEGTITVQ